MDVIDRGHSINQSKDGKPKNELYKKRWFWVVVVVVLIVVGLSSSRGSHNGISGNNNTNTNKAQVAKTDNEEINAVDKFVELYNKNNSQPITNISSLDIHNQSDPLYRIRFRLDAYKQFNAITGKIGDVTICVVQSDYDKPLTAQGSFLVYAFGADNTDTSFEKVKNIMANAAGIAWISNPNGSKYVRDIFDKAKSEGAVMQDENVSANVFTVEDSANWSNKPGVWQGELRNIDSSFAINK